MKYVIVIGDGMADNPLPELGGKTPLEAANIPVIDSLSRSGVTGSVKTVPDGIAPGSDTAILSICGCDPRVYYSGRAPLEAAGAGVSLTSGDVAYRCNMVTFEDGDMPFAEKKILSHNGGGIDGESSLELIEAVLADKSFALLAAELQVAINKMASFRHIAVQKGADITGFYAAPPHDYTGEVIAPLLPRGCAAADGLAQLMRAAHEILDGHPISERRRAAGKLPANGIWFWAEGTVCALPDFKEKTGKCGFVVSAVPLVWGIGALLGLERIDVTGATGELDTNYEGKADAVIQGLRDSDFALLHVEAPDECTHAGDLQGKLEAIERLDGRTLLRLKTGLDAMGDDYRLLILSDHKTLMATRGHDGTPVPFILYDSRETSGSGFCFNEANCEKGMYIEDGHTIIDLLFKY